MGPEGAPRATARPEFPRLMNDDVSRRGCSLETHCISLIPLSDFSGVFAIEAPQFPSHIPEFPRTMNDDVSRRGGFPETLDLGPDSKALCGAGWQTCGRLGGALWARPALWGSQSWLQPAFSRLSSSRDSPVSAARDAPEGTVCRSWERKFRVPRL